MTPGSEWTQSSFCGGGNCVQIKGVTWTRSSFCSDAACVEVLRADALILVRDSKNPDQRELSFTRDEWRAFIEGVKAGEFG